MEAHILQTLDREGEIQDTGDFASSSGYDHSAVVSSMNSLQAHDMVSSEVLITIAFTALHTYLHWYDSIYEQDLLCCRRGAIVDGCSQPRPANIWNADRQKGKCMQQCHQGASFWQT